VQVGEDIALHHRAKGQVALCLRILPVLQDKGRIVDQLTVAFDCLTVLKLHHHAQRQVALRLCRVLPALQVGGAVPCCLHPIATVCVSVVEPWHQKQGVHASADR